MQSKTQLKTQPETNNKRPRVPSITDTRAPIKGSKGFSFLDPPGTISAEKARKKVVAPRKKGTLVRITSGPQALSRITGSWDPKKSQYQISEVVIGGRTPSPFGSTMGAHSTAWVAHVDSIRRHLVGTDLQNAVKSFVELMESELNSPLLELKKYIGKDHQQKLDEASDALKAAGRTLINANNATLTEDTYNAVLQHLRSTINIYLTYVNFLPMATVSGGDPSGHGEGVARGELTMFEAAASIKHSRHGAIKDGESLETITAVKTNENGQIQVGDIELTGIDAKLKKLLTNDLSDEAEIKYKQQIRTMLWQMFAAETPMIFLANSSIDTPTHSQAEVWAFAIQNFLRTIRMAYPYAYSFSEIYKVKYIEDSLGKGELKKKFKANADKVIALLTGKAAFTNDFTLSANDQVGPSKLNHQAVGISDYTKMGTELQATVLLTANDKIGDIHFQGRTQSPFGSTMGAHSTAWIVHLDAVSRKLKDESLPDAYQMLKSMTTEAFNNDALEYAGVINEKHQIFLIAAYNVLKNLISETNFSDYNIGTQHAKIEKCISAYLNFLNLIPLSTVESGGLNGGRTEGLHRKFLQNYELYGDDVFGKSKKSKAEILTDHLMGMFDIKGVQNFIPEVRDEVYNFSENVEYDDGHFLSPKLGDFENEAKNTEEYALQNFVNTIAEAYPKSYENSALRKRILKKYGIEVKDPEDHYKDKVRQRTKRTRISKGWTKKVGTRSSKMNYEEDMEIDK
ncbi:hypothetical protein GCM10028819_10010 [Spirosoma humi]